MGEITPWLRGSGLPAASSARPLDTGAVLVIEGALRSESAVLLGHPYLPVLKNIKRERFAQEMAKGSTTYAEAYGAAGYVNTYKNVKQSANRLACQPDVRARINELMERRADIDVKSTAWALEKANVTKLRIVQELEIIGFARMDRFTSEGSDGERLIDFSKLPDEDPNWAAVKGLTVDTYMEGHGDEAREVKKTRLTLHDKRSALIELARMHGMIAPPQQNTQNNFHIYLDGEDARS